MTVSEDNYNQESYPSTISLYIGQDETSFASVSYNTVQEEDNQEPPPDYCEISEEVYTASGTLSGPISAGVPHQATPGDIYNNDLSPKGKQVPPNVCIYKPTIVVLRMQVGHLRKPQPQCHVLSRKYKHVLS